MERNEFQELLFQTAFCVVASDGHIDEREIEQLRSLEGSAVYFQGIDLRDELDRLVTSLHPEGEAGSVDGGPIAEVLKKIKTGRLSVVQELLLLELALRILHADENIHDKEVELVRQIRTLLTVDDGILLERFGPTQVLFESEYKVDEGKKSLSDVVSDLEVTDTADLSINTIVISERSAEPDPHDDKT